MPYRRRHGEKDQRGKEYISKKEKAVLIFHRKMKNWISACVCPSRKGTTEGCLRKKELNSKGFLLRRGERRRAMHCEASSRKEEKRPCGGGGEKKKNLAVVVTRFEEKEKFEISHPRKR